MTRNWSSVKFDTPCASPDIERSVWVSNVESVAVSLIAKLSNASAGSHELNIIAKFNFKNQEDNRKGIEQVNF